MSSQKLFVQLGESRSTVRWRVEKGSGSWIPGAGGDDYGEVSMLDISRVKAAGKNGMELVHAEGGAVAMELTAEDVATRDAWVLGLSELLDKWKADPSCKPMQVQLRATETSDKTEYYEKRQADMKAREKDRQERKMKYMKDGANMKFTAQAMLNRPDK
jgi:hypothetical protein